MFKRPLCILAVIILAVFYLCLFIRGGVDLTEYVSDDSVVNLEGNIEDIVCKNGTNVVYIKSGKLYKGDYKTIRNGNFIVYLSAAIDDNMYHIGQRVLIRGIYSNFTLSRNEGNFNLRHYYRIRGYEGALKRARIIKYGINYNKFSDGLHNIKQNIEKKYDKYLDEEASGTLKALVLGDKSSLNEEVKELYQDAGISHILCLSGLHISTLGLMLLRFLRKMRLKKEVCIFTCFFIMLSYAVMTGFNTSTKRALVMFIVSVMAEIFRRTYDLLSALSLSIILIVFENPYYIFDTGFMLSCLCVLAIAIIYPVFNEISERIVKNTDVYIKYINLRTKVEMKNKNIVRGELKQETFAEENHNYSKDKREKAKLAGKAVHKIISLIPGYKLYKKVNELFLEAKAFNYDDAKMYKHYLKQKQFFKFVDFIRKSLCVGISTYILTLPVVMNTYYRVSRYGIFLNIFVCFIVGVILLLGVMGGISFGFLLIPCQYLFGIYNIMADFSTSLTGNIWVTGKAKDWQVTSYILLIAALIYFYLKKIKQIKRDYEDKEKIKVKASFFEDSEKKRKDIFKKKTNRVGMLFLSGIMLSVIVLSLRFTEDTKIIFTDIGQGACSIVCGSNRPVLMFDGGSTDIKKAGKYRVVPTLLYNNIDKIDYVFLSHMDADHINAVKEIISGERSYVRVGTVICSYLNEEMEKIVKEKNINVIYMKRGDVIKIKGYRVECLWPDSLIDIKKTYEASNTDYKTDISRNNDYKTVSTGNTASETISSESDNDKSLVLKFTDEKTGFSVVFPGDISSDTEEKIINSITRTDVTVMPHHGSKYSGSSEFISKTASDFYIISAGINNSYGHPHEETLNRLKEHTDSKRILRTDLYGQITILINNDNMIIKKHIGNKVM